MGIERVAPALSLDELLRISANLDVRFHALRGDAVVTSKDAQALVERDPDLERQLSEAERALLRRPL
jgi:hypothetical protein